MHVAPPRTREEIMKACLLVLLGSVCTLLAGASAFYMVVFYSGVYGRASIHLQLPHHYPSLVSSHPIINNLLLLTVFFETHSLLARDWIKRVFSPLMSQSLYRQLYFLLSSVTLFLATYGWSPLPLEVWHVESPSLKLLLYGIQLCGIILTVVSFFSLQPLEFCGLKKPIDLLMGTRDGSSSGDHQAGDNQLTVTGVYSLARHPMYTGVLLFLWSQPTMAQGQLLLTLTATLYLLLVVPWLEEPDLIREFGQKYRDYMNTTGMFFPYSFTSRKKIQ